MMLTRGVYGNKTRWMQTILQCTVKAVRQTSKIVKRFVKHTTEQKKTDKKKIKNNSQNTLRMYP